MKKHLIAAAALATLSTAAFAQSVTVYGIIDQSIWKNNNASTTSQSLTSMESGAWLPSVIGFTGTEDLGGGLKASFKLEGNINTDTGAQTLNAMFDRQAFVSVSGNFGSLTAGKQIDALFLQSFLNNVRLAHSNSAAVIGALAVDGTLDGRIFSPDSVTYVTPSFNGVKATIQHQFGEVAGSTKANSATAALVNYDVNGLSLSAGTKTKKANTAALGTDSSQTLFGAVYKLGNLQFNAQTNQYKFKEGYAVVADRNSKYTLNEFGIGYNVTPALVAAINYVDIDWKQAGTKLSTDVTSVSLKYSLSKRTSLWTMASRTDKVSGATAADSNITSAAPFYLTPAGDARKAVTGYGVGLTHTF
jgi:predicted porin